MRPTFHSLRVSAITPETPESASFTFEVPSGEVPSEAGKAFHARSGQYLTFQIPWNGMTLTRCYSLSSCPELNEPLRVCVKRVPGGRVSGWMLDQLRVGDTVLASEPQGRFVLEPQERTALVFFAGGSGITPVLSLIKAALATTERPVTLVYANRERASIIYGRELDVLVAAYPQRFRLHHHLDADSGVLTGEAITGWLPRQGDARYYLCGPAPFMALVEHTLLTAGVSPTRIVEERFVSPTDPDRQLGEAEAVIGGGFPERFSLWIEGRSRTVPYQPGQTLLESAFNAGLQPPHSCQSGYCGSCMVRVKAGAVRMRCHDALTEVEVQQGLALLCQSVPVGPELLELDCDAASFRMTGRGDTRRTHPLAAGVAIVLIVVGTVLLRTFP